MSPAAHVTWPVFWALFYLARITGVRAQSLSVYIDNVLYSSGSSVSCRPGATLLFQCEYLGADQSLVSPFPPSLCSLTSGNCRALQPISSPPWASGKLRANYTISGVISGTQSYGCLYRSPPTQSSVTITFTNSSVYPSNSNCVTGSATAATSTTSLTTATTTVPPTTTITTSTTATTKPSTSTSASTSTTTSASTSTTTSASTSTTTSASSTSKGTPSRTSPPSTSSTSPAGQGLTDLNPLIYTVVGVFLLGVLAIIIIITCWIRARRMFNSRMVNLRTTTSPFDYLDYINESNLTPITTTEFIISMQQQRPPTYNQSQELEVLSSDGNPPSLPPRNGTRSTEAQTTVPTEAQPLTRHPNDSASPEEAEAIESRISAINRRLNRASRGQRQRHVSFSESDTVTLLSSSERDASSPDLGNAPSQPEGNHMSLLL